MARPGASGGHRQVAPDVASQIEEVGHEEDSRCPEPDAPCDSRRNVGPRGLEEAGFDDAIGKPGPQIARQGAQQPVRRADATAMTYQQESRGRRGPGSSQRAGPRMAARKRRPPSTTATSPPAAASSSRT